MTRRKENLPKVPKSIRERWQGWDVLFGYLDSGILLGYLMAINCVKLTVDYFRILIFFSFLEIVMNGAIECALVIAEACGHVALGLEI